jgi:hypothetical protein
MLAYGRMNKCSGGQIIESPTGEAGTAGKNGRPADEVPRAPKDTGCTLARACAECIFIETCQKCTRKLALCTQCRIFFRCPLMREGKKKRN